MDPKSSPSAVSPPTEHNDDGKATEGNLQTKNFCPSAPTIHNSHGGHPLSLSPTSTCVAPQVTTNAKIPNVPQKASMSGSPTSPTKRSTSLNLRPRPAPQPDRDMPESIVAAKTAPPIITHHTVASSHWPRRKDPTLNLANHKHSPPSSSSSSTSISSMHGSHASGQSSVQRHFARKLSFTPSEIRVLVVDRDKSHGERVSEHLSRAGYPVELVSSCTQVMAKLKGSPSPEVSPPSSPRELPIITESKAVHPDDTSLSNRFHLVLLDAEFVCIDSETLKTDVGDNSALGLLKKIRASDEFKDVPVIVMTPSDVTELAYTCLRSGADDYILKPVRQDVIKGVWRSVWRKRKEKKVLQQLEDEQRRGKCLEARIDVLQDQVSIAVETPINLITRTIKGLCCDERLEIVAKNALSRVLISLKSTNLYRPAFEKLLLDDQLDPETRSWLSNEVIGNTNAGASGPSKIVHGNSSPIVTLRSSPVANASSPRAMWDHSVPTWIPPSNSPVTASLTSQSNHPHQKETVIRHRRAASLGQISFDLRGRGEMNVFRKRPSTLETYAVKTNATIDTDFTEENGQWDLESPPASLPQLVIGGSKTRTSSAVGQARGVMNSEDKLTIAGENDEPVPEQIVRGRVSIIDSAVWVSAAGRRTGTTVKFPFSDHAEDDELNSDQRRSLLTTDEHQSLHEVSLGSIQQSDHGDGSNRASLETSIQHGSSWSRMPSANSISSSSLGLKDGGAKPNGREWTRRSRSASSPVQFVSLPAFSPQNADSKAEDSPGGENGGGQDDVNSNGQPEEAEVANRVNQMTRTLPTVEIGPFRLSAYTPFPISDEGNWGDTSPASSASNDSDFELGSHNRRRGRRKRRGENETDSSTDDMDDIVKPNPAQRLSQIRNWNFDVWSFAHSELIGHLVELFNDAGLLRHYQIPLYTLTHFLKAVERGYGVNRNPYHNFKHAWDVTQAGYLFLKGSCIKDDGASVGVSLESFSSTSTPSLDSSGESNGPDSAWDSLDLSPFDQHPHLFTMNERFAFLVACLCHDLSHDGKSNNFHITTRSPLALLYNDRSILENFHAHQTFSVLAHNPECDIMAALPTASKAEVRSLIIRCILATDLARHMEVLARFNEAANAWSWEDGEKRARALEMVMKCADVSNAMRPLHLAKGWADVLQQEMFAQGDLERKLGLPVSAFMDRTNPQQARLGLSFSDYMVAPLFRAVSAVLPKMSSHLARLLKVRAYWHDMLDAEPEKVEEKKSDEDFDQEVDACEETKANEVELNTEMQERNP